MGNQSKSFKRLKKLIYFMLIFRYKIDRLKLGVLGKSCISVWNTPFQFNNISPFEDMENMIANLLLIRKA